MIFESKGLRGLPCGTPFLRLVSLPLITIGALNHLRMRRSVFGGNSWRMDETYIKEKGEWMYMYRAVDKEGKTVDFLPYKEEK